jgi:hypothetical protein
MANELNAALGTTGLTVTAQLYTAGASSGSAISMTEIGSSGIYTGTMVGAAAIYGVAFLASSVVRGYGQIIWDGTAEVTANSVNVAKINAVSTSAVTTVKAVQGLTTADTIATYTGNTVQTGDAFAIVKSGGTGDNAAIKTMTDKIGTVTNTGGTATIGAVLGDMANSAVVTRLGAIKTKTDIIGASVALETGGILQNIHDTDLPAVKTDTAAVKIKTDYLPSVTAGGAGGVFIAGTNAATTITTALTTTFTGNLTGSVASVTGLTASDVGAIKTTIGTAGAGLTALGDTRLGYLTSDLAAMQTSITNLTNLSALANLFSPNTMVRPSSGSVVYPFTFVVKNTTGSSIDVDTNTVTLTAVNAAGTNRSAGLSAVTHSGTGEYTFTYTVASTDADEGLRFTAAGTVAAASRKAYSNVDVADADSLAALAAIQAQTDKLIFDGSSYVKSTPQTAVTIASSQHVIVDSGTVTTLTNLPTITAGWLTATGIAATALNGKGDWNIGKTGYTVSTVSDKTGYSISGTTTTFDALQTAENSTHGAGSWATVTGFATPTNITAATGVSLAASQHVIVDSGTVTTVTTLTNLPAVPTDWLTAMGVKADAVTKIQAGLSTYAGGAVASVTGAVGSVSGIVTANVAMINSVSIIGDGNGTPFDV